MSKALYRASFVYKDAILSDFEQLYMAKKEIPRSTRLILGGVGLIGVVFFGWMLYREGFQFTRLCYMLIASVMLVLAFSRGKARPDGTVDKYRRHYHNRRCEFSIDEEGIEMHLEGQKNYARSKFKEIYGLFDTDLCFYFVIKGKAYYILPKDALADPGEFGKYMEKKSHKRFQHYDLNGKAL